MMSTISLRMDEEEEKLIKEYAKAKTLRFLLSSGMQY